MASQDEEEVSCKHINVANDAGDGFHDVPRKVIVDHVVNEAILGEQEACEPAGPPGSSSLYFLVHLSDLDFKCVDLPVDNFEQLLIPNLFHLEVHAMLK